MDQAAARLMERILERKQAPTLSPLAVRLVEMASDDQADINTMAAIIEQDPGLTTRLLGLANSPTFRVSEQDVTSMRRALIFLGLREVRIMALGISLRHSLPLQKGDPVFYSFWRSSLHKAVLAQLLAARAGLEQPEEMFVAGLLQELGLPLMLEALEPSELEGFPGAQASLRRQLDWERAHLGLDHRQVGAEAMRRWGLPELLITCQRPLEPEEAADAPVELRVAALARMATEALFCGDAELGGVHGPARQWLGLGRDDLNQIMTDALEYVSDSAQALEVELDRRADLLEIMEKANSALAGLSSSMEPHVRRMVTGGRPDDEAGMIEERAVVNTLEAVAHEIRNPLMSVGGFARRLAKLLEDGGELRRYAEVIISEAGRLDGVLAEMTSLVQPFSPRPEPLSLTELVRGVCLRPRAGQGPAVRAHLPTSPLQLNADRAGLETTLELMLGYGAHLSGHGGDGSVHVHLAGRNGEAVMTVFGAGAAPAAQATMSDRSFGPELGLARARRIVEAHGGGMEVAPGPHGGGFVLSARLPRGPKS